MLISGTIKQMLRVLSVHAHILIVMLGTSSSLRPSAHIHNVFLHVIFYLLSIKLCKTSLEDVLLLLGHVY